MRDGEEKERKKQGTSLVTRVAIASFIEVTVRRFAQVAFTGHQATAAAAAVAAVAGRSASSE